jgi:hypothetical protein
MSEDRYEMTAVEADGDQIEVMLRVRDDPHVYAVRFSFGGTHRGASTGEMCSSPSQWASEVWIRLCEEVGTRGIESARRTPRPDGVVLLHL